jgi:hypothetical protein
MVVMNLTSIFCSVGSLDDGGFGLIDAVMLCPFLVECFLSGTIIGREISKIKRLSLLSKSTPMVDYLR